MGTDIHAFVEGKIGGKWHFIGYLNIGRDYELFGILSDVRGVSAWARYGLDGPLATPGVPDDLSPVGSRSMSIMLEADFHSPGWLSEEKVHKLFEILEEKRKSDDAPSTKFGFGGWCLAPTGTSLSSLILYQDYPLADEYRVVLCYDN